MRYTDLFTMAIVYIPSHTPHLVRDLKLPNPKPLKLDYCTPSVIIIGLYIALITRTPNIDCY